MNIPPNRSQSTSSIQSNESNESIPLTSEDPDAKEKGSIQTVVHVCPDKTKGMAKEGAGEPTALSKKEISAAPGKPLLSETKAEKSSPKVVLGASKLPMGKFDNTRSRHTTGSSVSSIGSDCALGKSLESVDTANSGKAPNQLYFSTSKGLFTRQRSSSESAVPTNPTNKKTPWSLRKSTKKNIQGHEIDSSPSTRERIFKKTLRDLDLKDSGKVSMWINELDQKRQQAAEELLNELNKKNPMATREDIEFEAVMEKTLRGICFGTNDVDLIVKLNKLNDQRNLVKATKLKVAKGVLDHCEFNSKFLSVKLACRDEAAENEAYEARFQYLSDLLEKKDSDKLLTKLTGIIGRPYVLKKDITTLKNMLEPIIDNPSAKKMIKDIDSFFADDNKIHDIIAVNKLVVDLVERISKAEKIKGEKTFVEWPENYRIKPSSANFPVVGTGESPKK